MTDCLIPLDDLRRIDRHHRSLGFQYCIKGLPYERCAELPYIIGYFRKLYLKDLRYLDIGSGESPLPTFFLQHTQWDITCIDKFSWVRKQTDFASRVMNDSDNFQRFHVIEEDFLASSLPPESFDIITNVSVIEHFEDDLDIAAMKSSGKLLKAGGVYILTTLINEGFSKEFYLNKNIYGAGFRGDPVFYQRHYDIEKLQQRLIVPSGLREKARIYFGDYEFTYFERILQCAPKFIRIFFQWANPFFARRFLSYRNYPISRSNMKMNTESGVILILEKDLS